MSNPTAPPPRPEASDAPPYETTLFVRDHCWCLHAQRAARALARRFDIALKPAGLTSGQFSLLTALNRPTPPSLGAVADLLAMDRTTLTANLKPLERRGLLRTERDPKDKRSRLLILTEEGGAALKTATPIWCAVHAEIDAELGERNLDALRDGLRALEGDNP